jgi:uncharacterized protein (DUF1015 family)
VLDTLAEAVASAPVLIADGHHRYATAVQYRDEQGGPGPHDLTMAYVVELVDEQLSVEPIHRLLSGLPDELDLLGALEPWFEVSATEPRRSDEGLVLVTRDGASLLRPREAALAGVRELDSSRLDHARQALPEHRVRYQHGVDNVLQAVDKGDAQAGVLLRPATVDQIVDIAHGGELMPPKTTFFWPKPRTGLVFRRLDDS